VRGGASRGSQQLLGATAHLLSGFLQIRDLALQSGCRERQQPGRSCHPRVTGRRPRGRQRPSLGLHFPVCQAGGARRGGRRLLPSKRRRKQKSPAPPPAHSRTAPGRTRSSPARRQPGTRGHSAAPAACPMALKRIQKVSGCQNRPGCPQDVPRNPGRTVWEGRGHWGGRGTDRPAQVRRASARSGYLEPRGDPIRSCPFQDEPRTSGAGARGVARLSRGVCIPAGPGLALQRAAFVPYPAVRPHNVPGALLAVFAPRVPREGREGVVGLRPLFSERGAGSFWALQSAGAQWEERAGNARLGPRSQQRALAPAILVVLHAAATSGHIAVLRT
jgi:hypothetical protein